MDVNIEQIPPLRVASVLGRGPQPEDAAWRELDAWAGPRGLLGDLTAHPIYGFNNPSPTAGNPEYGYELWIAVEPGTSSGPEVVLKDFAGGLYAVGKWYWTDTPDEDIPAAWSRMNAWLADSPYRMGEHQWLERSFEDAKGKGLELCLPIVPA